MPGGVLDGGAKSLTVAKVDALAKNVLGIFGTMQSGFNGSMGKSKLQKFSKVQVDGSVLE